MAQQELQARIGQKRRLFAQQVLLIDELQRIKRRHCRGSGLDRTGITEPQLNQINAERELLAAKAGFPKEDPPRPFSVEEHRRFLSAAKLFQFQGKLTDAGYDQVRRGGSGLRPRVQVARMVGGRSSQQVRLHDKATALVGPGGWQREHTAELRTWLKSLSAAPTLADLLAIKKLPCGAGRTVSEIADHIRSICGEPAKPMIAPAESEGSQLIERLADDNRALAEEIGKCGRADPEWQLLMSRFEKNLVAIDVLAPRLKSRDLGRLVNTLPVELSPPGDGPVDDQAPCVS